MNDFRSEGLVVQSVASSARIPGGLRFSDKGGWSVGGGMDVRGGGSGGGGPGSWKSCHADTERRRDGF